MEEDYFQRSMGLWNTHQSTVPSLCIIPGKYCHHERNHFQFLISIWSPFIGYKLAISSSRSSFIKRQAAHVLFSDSMVLLLAFPSPTATFYFHTELEIGEDCSPTSCRNELRFVFVLVGTWTPLSSKDLKISFLSWCEKRIDIREKKQMVLFVTLFWFYPIDWWLSTPCNFHKNVYGKITYIYIAVIYLWL